MKILASLIMASWLATPAAPTSNARDWFIAEQQVYGTRDAESFKVDMSFVFSGVKKCNYEVELLENSGQGETVYFKEKFPLSLKGGWVEVSPTLVISPAAGDHLFRVKIERLCKKPDPGLRMQSAYLNIRPLYEH